MKKRGFTLIELLVVVAIIALLIGLLLPALAKARRNAASMKDKTQIREIHQSMLVWAEDNKNRLPTPGLIDRQIDVYTGQNLPGRGLEDTTVNLTGPLFSALIALEFFNPDIAVGPTETNPLVREDEDFDYGAYDPSPSVDQYWDPFFTADLMADSNVSYFHMAICGRRKKDKWRNTQEAGDPVLSTRGTQDGEIDGNLYNDSLTLQLHGADRQWVGNIVFNDNSAATIDNFFPNGVSYEATDTVGFSKDNIFAAEFTDYGTGMAGADAYLVMSPGQSGSTDTSVTTSYDDLAF